MAQKFQNPMIAGQEATFEWHGEKAPGLIGDFNQWDPQQAILLQPVSRRRWAITMRFPQDAYVEYAFLLDGARVADPGNPQVIFNGINEYNRFFYMPGCGPTPLIKRRRGVQHGTLQQYKINANLLYGRDEDQPVLARRSVTLYQPADEQPCPLVVVFDGPDYLRRSRLPVIVDNLLAQGRIRPIALAMIANGGKMRSIEYSCSELTLEFIHSSVLPLAKRNLNLADVDGSPGSYGVLGASMGGLISLYTALRAPQIFGHVLSQAGAFYPGYVVNDLVCLGAAKSLKIWMDVGTLDFLLEDNRRMHKLLLAQGYNVSYREFNAGHNYTAWQNNIERGLVHLFGV